MSGVGGLYQIKFDPADAANTNTIGSYLIDSAGALITSTTVGGKQRLDVQSSAEYAEDSAHVSGDFGQFIMGVRNDAGAAFTSADGDYSPIAVDSTGRVKVIADLTAAFDFVYAEDAAHTTGDPGAAVLAVRQDTLASSTSADGDYGSFKQTASGELYVRDSGANTTLSSILSELQSITYAEDSAHSSTDPGAFVLGVRNDSNAVLTSADGDYSPIATDSAGRVKIVGTLTFSGQYAEDSAHVSGDTGLFSLAVRNDANSSLVGADGDYAPFQVSSVGDLKTVSRYNGALLQQEVSVATTATALPASALAGRKHIVIQNTSGKKIYVGSATVTTSGATKGMEVPAGGFWEADIGPAVSVYAIVASGTADIVVVELS